MIVDSHCHLDYAKIYVQLDDIINRAINSGVITYAGSKKFVREYIHVMDAAKASVNILNNKYKNYQITKTSYICLI